MGGAAGGGGAANRNAVGGFSVEKITVAVMICDLRFTIYAPDGANLFLNTARYRCAFPPHPGPLPEAEGDRWRRHWQCGSPPDRGRLRIQHCSESGTSLSLRERAGVRGNTSFLWAASRALNLHRAPD